MTNKSNKLNTLKCSVSYNSYGAYCVPESSRHRPVAKKILSNIVHEPDTLRFIMDNCKDADVVHAGTYFGDFLPALSTGIASGSKVWAFEPNNENYRCAKITLELNDIKNIVLRNAGLGDEHKIVHLQTTDETGRSLGGMSHVVASHTDIENSADKAQIVKIDDVINDDRNVSIIQLDVEGHEKEALSGSLKTIKRCRPTLIIEIWPSSKLVTSDWFAENIFSLGYREIQKLHGNTVFACESKI